MNPDPSLVDPDLLEGLQQSLLLLGQCLAETLPRNTVDQLLEELLTDSNPQFEHLNESQRLRVWQVCQVILNRVYRPPED